MKKEQQNKTAIIIVDDHPIVREGMRALIDNEPDMRVCHSTANERELNAALSDKNQVDLLIIDLSLSGRNGLEIIKDMSTRYPHIRKLVVSMHNESTYIERALRAGADGYVSKQEAPYVIIEAIHAVMNGQSYISPHLLSSALRLIGGKPRAEEDDRVSTLSDRELEVLEHIGHGRGTSEIARILNLSVNTIATHRRHILEKLAIPSSGLVKFAVEWLSGSL